MIEGDVGSEEEKVPIEHKATVEEGTVVKEDMKLVTKKSKDAEGKPNITPPRHSLKKDKSILISETINEGNIIKQHD